MHSKHYTQDIFSNCRNKRSQYYDQWRKLFDQQIKTDLRAYENITKIATGQLGSYTSGCLLDFYSICLIVFVLAVVFIVFQKIL